MSAGTELERAQFIKSACEEVGFFYVSHHGVDPSVIAEAYEQNALLFDLPMGDKMALLADSNSRGYTPFREETLDPAHQVHGDNKEGYYIGREVSASSPEARKPLHGPNQWPCPKLLPNYRPAVTRYFEAVQTLGYQLLRLLSLSLGLPPDHFSAVFDKPLVMLRPLHYSAAISKPSEGIFGAGAHSDYGMLTILSTDSVPGLEIQLGGSWTAVEPIPDTFIVNLGDLLERWTNGLYRSTRHRVVNTSGKERYSLAFFFEPNFDTVVECLPQCTGPGHPVRFPPTTSGQHILDKYAETHAGYTGPITA
ncbi:MAG: hypothetical protein WDW38_009303 [Sanguina aurantia]